MDALDGHMVLGQDYAVIIAFMVISHSLVKARCNHVADLNIENTNHYWCTLVEAKAISKKFFDEFQLVGRNDMAIMQGAYS